MGPVLRDAISDICVSDVMEHGGHKKPGDLIGVRGASKLSHERHLCMCFITTHSSASQQCVCIGHEVWTS